MQNFWQQLPKPILALAPMADVTDAAFRHVVAKYSKRGVSSVPYVTYTEFVSADGLALAPEEGRQKLLRDLLYTDAERPIVAQFFTATPKHMEAAAKLAAELGFNGVDINMGCPDRTIEKQGAGAKLIQTPQLAQELIAAARQGAPNLPVSVKTRLGYHHDELEGWLQALLAAEPAAVIIHARTRKEMSAVPAHWERIARAVEIRNEQGSNALILGNGDLKDVADARQKVAESGADGAMLGRAVFGNPWLFASEPRATHSLVRSGPLGQVLHSLYGLPEVRERLEVAVEHTKLFEELLGGVKSFAVMKKHFKAYAEGFAGARELRMQVMECHNAAEVETLINTFLHNKEAQYT